MKGSLDIFLERGYWISQMVLMMIAAGAAVAAFRQLQTYKLFEILKFLESPEFRSARRIVLREIHKRKDVDWWLDQTNGERWEEAASAVCAGYDILAKMIEYDRSFGLLLPGYGKFFRLNWARSIIRNHDALKKFLKYRREIYPSAYMSFTHMADNAEKITGPIRPPQPI